MIKQNELFFNRKSTADFPFFVAVETNDGIRKAERKDILHVAQTSSAVMVQKMDGYEMIEKSYTLYIHGAKLTQMSELLAWLDGDGTLTPYDNPERYYNVLKVKAFAAQMDEVGGYQVEVTFICEPFSYKQGDQLKILRHGQTIENNGHTYMCPRIDVYGSSGSEVSITIGDQVVYLKNLDEKVTIECREGYQNVFDKNGFMINSIMKGPFFKIPKGSNGISLSNEISHIAVLYREGEFA